MSRLRVLCLGPRTASLLVCPEGTRFALSPPLRWSLRDGSGAVVATGTTEVAPLFLEGLSPETDYTLHTSHGPLPFRTKACTGLVEAGDHGVTPDAPDNAEALSRAIAATPEGGTLRLPPGRYRSGPIFLKPRMTLLIEHGAELAAIADRSDWPILPAHDENGRVLGTWEGLPEPCFAALVTAIDCDGLEITGGGIIDGGGDRGDWWTWPKERRDGARRPRTLHIAHSESVRLTGFTVRNSPSWTVHPYACTGLHVSALSIQNPPDSPNTDGLNPESCREVTITGVDFSVGDDCIAIKAGKRQPGQTGHLAPTRDIAIRHCRMARGHGAVVLGSEMSGGISDVTISDCSFHATDRGLRLKTRRGRGGIIERITLARVDMFDVPTPLAVNAFYFCDPDGRDAWVQDRAPAPRDETTPLICDIAMCNVRAEGVTFAAVAVLGLPEAPVTGLRLENFDVTFAPDAKAAPPLMALGVPALRHVTIHSENAEVTGAVTVLPTEEPTPC